MVFAGTEVAMTRVRPLEPRNVLRARKHVYPERCAPNVNCKVLIYYDTETGTRIERLYVYSVTNARRQHLESFTDRSSRRDSGNPRSVGRQTKSHIMIDSLTPILRRIIQIKM